MVEMILDKSLRTFCNRWKTFLLLTFLIAIPDLIVPSYYVCQAEAVTEVSSSLSLLFLLVKFFFVPVLMNMTICLAADPEASLASAYRSLDGRKGGLIWNVICYAVCLTVGMIFLIIPGVIVIFNGALVIPVYALENERGFNKVYGRSKELMKDYKFKYFFLLLVNAIFGLAFYGAAHYFSVAFTILTPLAVILASVTTVVFLIALTEFYHCMRADKEAKNMLAECA